jgi:hypothetical protein
MFSRITQEKNTPIFLQSEFRLKLIYWSAAIIGRGAFSALTLLILIGMFVDPIYDQQRELLANSVNGQFDEKSAFIKIEILRNSAHKQIGMLGGIIFGFVFGAFAVVLQKHFLKSESNTADSDKYLK